jgi:D-glycero-D-manno-heptose 1,7-bisphosphate phosphatase
MPKLWQPFVPGTLEGVMKPTVFLDRDGVICENIVRNDRPFAPQFFEDFVISAGVADAIEAFRDAGYLVIVVTNQPDVGARRQRRAVVEEMHAKLRAELEVDDIMICYHIDADRCECRKPKPGMLMAAATKHGIDLSRSWMIGDRWRDIGAGQAAGCRTVFIDYGFAEQRPQNPDVIVQSLAEAVPYVLGADAISSGEKQ